MPAVFGKVLDIFSHFCSVNCQSSCFLLHFSASAVLWPPFQQFRQGGVSVGCPSIRNEPWLKVMLQWSSSGAAPPGGHSCGISYSTALQCHFARVNLPSHPEVEWLHKGVVSAK